MKAKNIANELLKYPYFDVELFIIKYDINQESKKLKITGILDIGYSDKIIKLDFEDID